MTCYVCLEEGGISSPCECKINVHKECLAISLERSGNLTTCSVCKRKLNGVEVKYVQAETTTRERMTCICTSCAPLCILMAFASGITVNVHLLMSTHESLSFFFGFWIASLIVCFICAFFTFYKSLEDAEEYLQERRLRRAIPKVTIRGALSEEEEEGDQSERGEEEETKCSLT